MIPHLNEPLKIVLEKLPRIVRSGMPQEHLSGESTSDLLGVDASGAQL